MFGDRLKRYSGLIKLITILVTFIIVVMAGGAYIDENLVQRETYARVKTVNYQGLLLRLGADDKELREEIHEHLLMYRDGGRLATPYGPAWDYPPVKTESFLASIDTVLQMRDEEDADAYMATFRTFDETYAAMMFGRQRLINVIQYVAAGIIFFGFLGILAMLFFRLGKADDEALAVRKENAHIMASTSEGVFLVGKDYQIGEQQSGAVKELFGQGVSVSGNFLNFIKGFVAQEDLDRTEKYLGLVFGGRVKPRLMGDLNPLQNVEMIAERKIGGSVRKTLDFNFSRDEQSDTVDNLLVTVSDVTKETLLREELDTIQKVQDERLTLLKGLLHVEPAMLQDFFEKGGASYKTMNGLLEQGSVDPDGNVEKLQEIARLAHRMKGDAAALKLELFESSLHRFEDTLGGLQEQNLVDGQSLVTLVVQLKNMIAEMDLAVSLTRQFGMEALSEVDAEQITEQPVEPGDLFTQKLSTLALEVANRGGKKVNFSVSGAQHLNQMGEASTGLYEIAVQLVRNAIVHGIEAPERRSAQSKPEFGKLHISFEQQGNALSMSVRDDGQGLRFDKIRAKALALGLLNDANVDAASNKVLLKFLFSHGLSSSDTVSEDAGRGIGLDAVKKLIEDLNGGIKIGTEAGQHSVFKVNVPLAEKSEVLL